MEALYTGFNGSLDISEEGQAVNNRPSCGDVLIADDGRAVVVWGRPAGCVVLQIGLDVQI